MNKGFRAIDWYVKELVEIYKSMRYPNEVAYWYEKIREDPVEYVKTHLNDPLSDGTTIDIANANPMIDDVHDMGVADVAYFSTLLKSDISWNEYDEAMVVIRYDETAIAKDPILRKTGLNPFDIYGGYSERLEATSLLNVKMIMKKMPIMRLAFIPLLFRSISS